MFININNRKFWISCNKDSSQLTITWVEDTTNRECILLLDGERFTIYEVIQRLEKWSQLTDSELLKLVKGVL